MFKYLYACSPGCKSWLIHQYEMKIPWTEEPGGLQSMGSQRVGHDWATNFHFIPIIDCLLIIYINSSILYDFTYVTFWEKSKTMKTIRSVVGSEREAEHRGFQSSELFYMIFTVATLSKSIKWSEVAQSCLTLFDPMDCSLPGTSVHGISQARILEWVAISFSRENL